MREAGRKRLDRLLLGTADARREGWFTIASEALGTDYGGAGEHATLRICMIGVADAAGIKSLDAQPGS